MTQRLYTIETLGGRNSKNRKTILKRMNQLNGFDLGTSINKYKKNYGVTSADEMYELLRQEYNEDIENQRKKKIIIKKETKTFLNQFGELYENIFSLENDNKTKIKIENKKKKEVKKFMLHIKVSKEYKKKNPLTGAIYLSKPYYIDLVEGPFEKTISSIPSILKDYEFDEYSYIQRVISHQIEYMDTKKLKKESKPKKKQMMKRGFILTNNWLQYAKGISADAYTETDDKCVYYQLSRFLLDPPTGNPTKFINNQRLNEQSLYDYFNGLVGDELEQCDYPEFDMNKGVSTEMISRLCKDIKRNMYAYDEDNKCFDYVKSNSSKNYCPIIFYKLHGHFYIINDAKTMRSVAESNKETAKHIITSSVEEKTDNNDFNVYHLKTFPLDNIQELKKGVYILQQSNMREDVLKYYSKYQDDPLTKNNGNVIIQMKIKNNNDEEVIIACDTNYGSNIEYNQLLNVAQNNNIEYINQGVGSVITSIINPKKEIRQYLNEEEKTNLIASFNDTCAVCEMKCEKYIIDHIVPLASGGTNDISNLQPLCKDCNKKKTIEENEQGIYNIKDVTESFFNDIVIENVINTNHFKSYQFVEKVNELPEITGYDAFKVDMVKCRRNILYYSKFEFPVYSVMDIPTTFNGIVKCGMFYVNTENTYPFRGCGWYSQPLVEYGLNTNIISIDEIKLEFVPSKTLPNNHFQSIIDDLLKAFSCEPTLQKVCINAYIGLMGRMIHQASFSKFTLSNEVASNWWSETHIKYDDVFIRSNLLENGITLYEGIFTQDILSESSKYPIYSMILQMEAMELHKLETAIISKGGIILDRNTDAIRYYSSYEFDLYRNQFWDDENTILKYRPEEAQQLKIERLAQYKRLNYLEYDKFYLNWNTEYDYDCSPEEKAKEVILSNKSIHIDGRAGTGKTFITNKIINELKEQGKKYLAFSPTNKGARLIGGKTIHSMFYKYQHNKKKLFDSMKDIDYIFIDEISMMIEKFYQLFMMIKRTFSKVKFIISGDFGQLPPVNDSWTGDYKNSSCMWSLCDGNRLQLMKCRRADSELFSLCKNVETIDTNIFPVNKKTFLNLAYTHNSRIKVNNDCMERFLKNNSIRNYITIDKDTLNPKTQLVKLAVGMPVISHMTDKKLDILNSETFKIKSVNNETIEVIEHDRIIKINTKDFHKYFYLGFCITIHASQGETFDEPYTIYDWNFYHFCDKAKYVALSRGTNIKNIQIN